MSIIDSIKSHLEKDLPFVAYRKPDAKNILGFFQKNNTLFCTDTYNQSGFVFAPFDTSFPSVLIPESASNVLIESWIPHLDTNLSVLHESYRSSKDEHSNLVARAVQEIKKTRVKKIVISRKEKLGLENTDFVSVFLRLLATYGGAMVYMWYHPKVGLWMGATPETLLKLNGDSFSTMSLAATRPYENTLEIPWNAKELEEQSLVTDFIAHQIDVVSKNYTIHERETVRAGNVVHLRTIISGFIKEKENGLRHLIEALHPTPAVCGLPREDAKQFILLEEGYERKYYTGFLGEIHVESNSELFVNLRCMEIQDDSAFLYVGGGITADSVPEEEWKETVLKTRTLKKVLQK